MGLIDSHAHLTSEALAPGVGAVLGRAWAAGVEAIIAIATDMEDAGRVIELASSDRRVFAAVGIHPHEAGHVTEADWTRFEGVMTQHRVVALGEMGLDYHYDFADRATQHTVFQRQLELASSTDLPIVIHNREAHGDTIAILRQGGYGGRRVVFHCFTGSETEAEEIAANGWRISFTGVVTFKNAGDLRRIATQYPIDQLMIETDSPFLSPVPVRHVQPNEPAHVAHIARFLAQQRGMGFEELAAHTSANTRAFFGLERTAQTSAT